MNRFFAVLGFSLLLWACRSQKEAASSAELRQGISGYVKERVGNQMPSPDAPASEGRPLRTTVFIYEATSLSQVERTGSSPFYSSVKTKLVKTTEADSSGYFSAELPAGRYSVFTKVDGQFYANSFDSQNNIALVTVVENKVTEVNITVSARARL